MEQMSHHKILSMILLTSLVIIISLLCLTITKFIMSPNNLSESHTRYTEKLGFPVPSRTITKKCEFIVTSEDENYIDQIKLKYPNCKVITKSKLYEFNLIYQLLKFFE